MGKIINNIKLVVKYPFLLFRNKKMSLKINKKRRKNGIEIPPLKKLPNAPEKQLERYEEQMREIRIKMWDLDVDYDLAKASRKPITSIYWLSSEKIEELGVEGFKKVAREKFEEMLEKWEKENAE